MKSPLIKRVAVLLIALLVCFVPFDLVFGSSDNSYGKCPGCGGDLVFTGWTTEPTCTENGYGWVTCVNGDYRTQIEEAAYGHDFHSETFKEASCVENGLVVYTCYNCWYSFEETTEALGHDLSYTDIEPTCTEEGHHDGHCSRCGADFKETIPAKGHKYPYLWTVEQEAGFFREGLETKTCEVCGEKMSRSIPKKDKSPLVFAAIGTVAAILLIIVLVIKPKKKKEKPVSNAKQVRSVKPEVLPLEKEMIPAAKEDAPVSLAKEGQLSEKEEAKEFPKVVIWPPKNKEEPKPDVVIWPPSLAEKEEVMPQVIKWPPELFEEVLVCTKNEKLLGILKRKHFLGVKTCEKEELFKTLEDSAPDLLIADISDNYTFETLLEKKKDELKNTALGLIICGEPSDEGREELDQFKKDGSVLEYFFEGDDPYEMAIGFELPVLKPDLNSDATLKNEGKIAGPDE